MRVSNKALAPLSALLLTASVFTASCVTPPPMPGPGRSMAYGQSEPAPDRYAAPSRTQGRDPYQDRRLRPADPTPREASWDTWREDPRESARADDPRRFDDGRYNLRLDGRGETVAASYDPQQGNYDRGGAYDTERTYDGGYYDDRYADPVPPHERGDYSARSNGRLSFLFGRRNLDDEGFLAADEPYSFGLEFSQPVEPGTLGFEFGFSFGADQEDNVTLPATANFGGGIFDVDRDMAEIYAGFRTEFSRTNIRPYIGGGGVLMNMSERRSQGFLEAEDDDSTVGGYLHGGVHFDINEIVFLGVDFRRVFGSEVELFDQDLDTDYSQLSFVLGLSL